MRILLDHCTPKRLRRLMPLHEVRTCREMGWEELKNGRFLNSAEGNFDILLTVDRSIPYQQNMSGRTLSILIMRSKTNRFEELRACLPAVEQTLAGIGEGVIVEVAESSE